MKSTTENVWYRYNTSKKSIKPTSKSYFIMKAVISQGIDTALSRYCWLPVLFYEQHLYFNQ